MRPDLFRVTVSNHRHPLRRFSHADRHNTLKIQFDWVSHQKGHFHLTHADHKTNAVAKFQKIKLQCSLPLHHTQMTPRLSVSKAKDSQFYTWIILSLSDTKNVRL